VPKPFANSYNFQVPILLAPMAAASAPSLSIAVANAGGLGSCGAARRIAGSGRHWLPALPGSEAAYSMGRCDRANIAGANNSNPRILRSTGRSIEMATPARLHLLTLQIPHRTLCSVD
jgi:NAD(P)H-dependent flavin oxidoreductase YrpB (nitropropane dioxygenase family)